MGNIEGLSSSIQYFLLLSYSGTVNVGAAATQLN
jgi:hypothetical protein